MRGLRIIQRGAPLALSISIALYSGALVFARRHPARPASGTRLPRIGQRVPALTGYSAFGTRIGPSPAGGCALIHYVSGACEFCSAEAPAFAASATTARTAGCSVWTIAASAGRTANLFQLDTVGHAPIIYLPYTWSAAVPFRIAPTTMLLNRSHRVVWLRVGALDPLSESSLKSAIQAAAAR